MNKKISYSLILISAVLVFVSIYFYSKLNLNQSVANDNLNKIEDLQNKIETLSIKNDADEYFLQGEFETALNLYQKFDSITGSNYFITRKEWLEIQENSSEQLIIRTQLLQASLNKAQSRIDSLTNLFAENFNKLSGDKKTIDSLFRVQKILRDSIAFWNKKALSSNIDTLNFVSSTGNQVKYYGKISNGKANGIGVGFWSTGGYYFGEWRNNFRHGKGLYIWKNGDKYHGDFYDDKREGIGTYQWYQGERYEGEWKSNQRSGTGTLYGQDGNIKHKGKWLDDKPLEN